ncbi:MAG: serine/threonine protein kinase [Blastocatellia bacterium]|nr:serine/threonine protein kinase [Blastocatellia bacterium]
MEKWQKIEEIFHTAIAQPTHERLNYLNQICAEDPTLRQEVESLLAFSEEAQDIGFLKDSPILNNNLWSLESLIGQIIDNKYRIEKQLGQGGMGAVYLATHLGTGRAVAIKIIAPQYMGYSEFVERFKREAEATGRLRHPNVVNVTDFGFAQLSSDKLAYLVMEYLSGSTLGSLLKENKKLSLDLIVDIVEQICLAVEAAHESGIIHRDLKPDNIWLEPNGRGGYNVKVLDFGLAKLRDLPNFQNTQLSLLERLEIIEKYPSSIKSLISNINRAATSEDQSTLYQLIPNTNITNIGNMPNPATHGNVDPKTVPVWLTRVGMVLGTPLYMSPEQCHGKSLDIRSDVYSIGIITYQMLTGEVPFNGDLHQLIDKHTNMPPPVVNRKDIPIPVIDSIMMALSKNPADRPKSATAFATALKANSQGEIAIIRQAISLYSNNFLELLTVSLISFLPFILTILTGCLFLILPFWKWLPIDPIFLFLTMSGFSVPAIFFINLITGCIITPTVVQMLDNNTLSSGSLFIFLRKRIFDLAIPLTKLLAIPLAFIIVGIIINLADRFNIEGIFLTLFLAAFCFSIYWGIKVFSQYAFYAPIVAIENLPNKEAIERSRVLFNQIKNSKTIINTFLLVTLMDLTVLCTTLIWALHKILSNKPDNLDVFMSIAAGSMGFYATALVTSIIAPILCIYYSLFYLKARQSRGETFEEIVKQYKIMLETK